MRKVLILIASFAFSLMASLLWWKAWMYEGWIRAPRFLLPFFDVDGEAVGDVVLLEMFVIIQILLIVLIIIFKPFGWTNKDNSKS